MSDQNRKAPAMLMALTAGMVMTCLASTGSSVAQERSSLRSLRGELKLDAPNPPPPTTKQATPADGTFGRAYRQQPPLIPHSVEGYQLTRTQNQCMSCHHWPANTKVGAPKISESHYNDREGYRLDSISGTRFFCTQCHVPQADAKPLVGNAFRSASEVK